ncbi:alpha/beta fold hydrolase [Sphingopyxis sp. 550A]
MRQAIADAVTLCFDEAGQGEPLVLLHGSNADRRQFGSFLPLLGDGIRALAPDQRDSPDSPCEPRPYAMEDHARDLAAFLTKRGIERAHVFGASYGGAVAMTFALLFPDRVQSLILGATASERARFHTPDLSAIRDDDPAAVRRFMLAAVVTPDAIDDEPDLVAELDSILLIRESGAFARRAAAIDGHDVTDRLNRITAPTLVLCGDHDPIAHADEARQMAAAIPGARFELLPESRHGITLQYRERTARLIRDFVFAHSQGARA